MKIVPFLLARIAEDEKRALSYTWPNAPFQTEDGLLVNIVLSSTGRATLTFQTEKGKEKALETNVDHALSKYATERRDLRAWAECEAKRRIIGHALDWPNHRPHPWDFAGYSHGNDILFALASVYKDHEDYDPEWAVN